MRTLTVRQSMSLTWTEAWKEPVPASKHKRTVNSYQNMTFDWRESGSRRQRDARRSSRQQLKKTLRMHKKCSRPRKRCSSFSKRTTKRCLRRWRRSISSSKTCRHSTTCRRSNGRLTRPGTASLMVRLGYKKLLRKRSRNRQKFPNTLI